MHRTRAQTPKPLPMGLRHFSNFRFPAPKSHRAGVASTYSESQKHNPALEVGKNNSKTSKIAKRMAMLDELSVRQTKLNEGERDGEGG